MTIGEKIKRLRISLDLTQEALAKASNTTKQTIHKYETGIISNIPASKLKLMADKLNVTPAYLMGWEEVEKKNDTIADIVLRLRADVDFLDTAKILNELSPEQFNAVRTFLSAFGK